MLYPLAMMATISTRYRTAFDLGRLLVIGVAAMFPFLGQNGNWASREIRHAEITREIAESRDYLIPRLLGEVYPDKPPVMHYFGAKLMQQTAEPTLFHARFPSAAAAVIGLLAAYALGRMLGGPREAFAGALVLLAMPGFYIAGRTARPDMVLVAFILLAAVLLGAGMQPRAPWSRSGFLLLAGLAAGIATVTKGPYGFLFPLVFLAFAPRQNPRLQRPTWEFLWFALGVVLVVGGWAAAVYERADDTYLRSVIFQKDLSSGGGAGHYEPFYWYLGPGFLQTLPVILFLPWAVTRLRRERRFPAALVMAATLLLVLSLVPGKRRHYLLPVLPFFALALAEGWIYFAGPSVRRRRLSWIIVALGIVANPAYYGPVVKWLRPEGDTEYRYVTEAAALLPPEANVICFGNMDENLAWVRRTTHGILSVQLPEQAARILRGSGTATHLMLSRKHLEALRQTPDAGEFEILLERPIDRRDSWLLARPVAKPPLSPPAPAP